MAPAVWGWGWGSAEPKVRIGVAGPLDEHRVALPVPHVPCAVVHLASKHTWSGDSGRTGKAYTHNLCFHHPLQLQNPERSGRGVVGKRRQTIRWADLLDLLQEAVGHRVAPQLPAVQVAVGVQVVAP